MKVTQVNDRARVQPDCVYVIPPNKDMFILHSMLHLLAPEALRGLRLPIDFFFRTLAQDQRGRSIGVILSAIGGQHANASLEKHIAEQSIKRMQRKARP